ncbi:MAG: LysE/ArgO family amino acid transporter [Pseudomonadota bacterium]
MALEVFAFVQGFATAFALILAIGAQNAFVLRQGLRGVHVFPVCLVCAVSDAVLITAGVAGFSQVVTWVPWLPTAMAIGGAVFLIGYGILRLRAAWIGGATLVADGEAESLRAAILACLAFTWLNPHVYLDTLALIGAVSVPFHGLEKWAFGTGAVLASFVFFFGLGYGARLIAPVMARPAAWRVLDTVIGCLMLALAAALLFEVWH